MAHDAGIAERTVLIEFDSFEQAFAAHESAAYQGSSSRFPTIARPNALGATLVTRADVY